MNLEKANEWLQSAYLWLSMVKMDVKEGWISEAWRDIKIVETRIKWVEEFLK